MQFIVVSKRLMVVQSDGFLIVMVFISTEKKPVLD